MVRRTAAEADQTRTQILHAAGRVFCAAGIAGATLEEIAGIAGVTRGAVYWHFGNKHGLLESICEDAAQAFESAFSAAPAVCPLLALVAMAEAFFRTVAGPGGTPRIGALLFKWGEQGGSDIVRARRIALGRRLREHAGACLERAVAARLLPDGTNVAGAALAYEAYVFGVLESWLLAPGFDLAAHARELAGRAVGLVRA